MKMFSFVKKVFFLGLTVLSSSITGALGCISMNNQECKVKPKIVDVSSNNHIFYLLVLKLIGAVVIVIVLIILMQRFVFQIL